MAKPVLMGSVAIKVFEPGVTERWLQKFKGALKVFAIPDTKKIAYLLHFIGPKSFDLLYDKIAPDDPYAKTYKELAEELENVYALALLEIAENFRTFRESSFNSGYLRFSLDFL